METLDNRSGWLDFGEQTKIAWSYVWGNVNNSNITTGVFNIDESKIDGITKNVGKPLIWYPSTNDTAEYISWDFDDAPDLEVFPEGLNDAIFFRVQ